AQEREQQTRRIDGCIVMVYATAVIEIAGDLAVLIRFGNDTDPLLEPARLVLRIPRHLSVVPRRVGAEKTPILAPIEIDLFGQRAQVRHGVEPLAANSEGQIRAELRLQ